MEHAASIHIFFSRRKSVQELFDVVERRGPIWTRLEDFSIVEDYNSLSNPDNDDDHFFNVIYAASYVLCFSTFSFFFRCWKPNLITYDPRACPGPLPAYLWWWPLVGKNRLQSLCAALHLQANQLLGLTSSNREVSIISKEVIYLCRRTIIVENFLSRGENSPAQNWFTYVAAPLSIRFTGRGDYQWIASHLNVVKLLA